MKKNVHNTLAVLPARGGSKRITKKSIVDFMGKPIIHYPLSELSNTGLFSEIHVSTDDAEIFNLVSSLGFPPSFYRDDYLSGDHTPVLDVLKWVLEQYRERGLMFDNVFLVMPCSPLLSSTDYTKAYSTFLEGDQKIPLLSVCKYPSPVEWALRSRGDGTVEFDNSVSSEDRSQDFSESYFDTGNFAIFNSEYLLDYNDNIVKRFVKYELEKFKVVDIDEYEDLELAKALFAYNKGLINGCD